VVRGGTFAATLIALACLAPAPAGGQAIGGPIPEGDNGGAPDLQGSPVARNPVRAMRSPAHPFMAPNDRSNIHDDPWMSDTYDVSGPIGRDIRRSSTLLFRECASITFDSRDRLVTVCVGLDGPQLVLMDPRTLRVLTSHTLPPRQPGPSNPFTDFGGGGYFYLDNQDRAVVPTTTRHIQVFSITPAPGFRLERDYDVSAGLASDDKVTSALPDWSGRIWFATDRGVVGTVDPASGAVRQRALGEPITNSFAVDETGGVFIVSDGALYRFDTAADGSPSVTWREPYPNSGERKPGQVSPGSGTTPTLMEGGLVTITDNASHLGVMVFHRGKDVSGPRLVCRQPVFDPGRGATDNSLIAAGRAIVVENNHGYSGLAAVESGQSTTPGIERVDILEDGSGCRSVWRNEERSPSVVPKLSLGNGLVYAYTKPHQPGGPDNWFLTAIDFASGRTAWKRFAGEGLGFNNNYAPVTLGPDGVVYVGVLGGLARFAGDTGEPPASEGAGLPCLPHRLRAGRRGLGRLRLRVRDAALVAAAGPPVRRTATTLRYCVEGGGRVLVGLSRRGRVQLVVSTARGHRARGLGPRSRARTLRRRLRGERRLRAGVISAGRRSSLLFGTRRGRVRWVGVASRSLRSRPRELRRMLLRVGLR
jgi:outer membrane protein assembly factor BamB